MIVHKSISYNEYFNSVGLDQCIPCNEMYVVLECIECGNTIGCYYCEDDYSIPHDCFEYISE
jgi:hypothetical protein